ncbi:hypothetical protein [Paraburkholderia caribensis]|nr:hypothetical protein [Paraburkholderia caribensis]
MHGVPWRGDSSIRQRIGRRQTTRVGEAVLARFLVKPVLLDTLPEHINALLAEL